MAGGEKKGRRGRLGSIAIGLAITVLVLVVLLAGFMASPLFERTLRAQVLPRVSTRVERRVEFERARGSLLPLVVRVQGLRVEGIGDYPIVRVDELALRVKIWPTLSTLGDTIALSVLRANGVEANLVRMQNGAWDLPTLPEVPPEERRTYVVDEATVDDGFARIHDPSRALRMEIRNIALEGSLSERAGSLRSFQAEVANGRVQAVARALLGSEAPSFTADVEMKRIDLGAIPPLAGTMDGILDMSTRLSGEGAERQALLASLQGAAEMTLENGRWLDLDFLEELATELGEFIYLPKGAAPESEEALDLGSPIQAAFQLEEGWVTITEPPQIEAAFGGTEVSGRVSLDQRLDLALDIGLSPEFLSSISEGLVEPEEPIPVTLLVRGTTQNPEFELTNTEALEAENPTFFRRLLRSLRNVLPTAH